jgi:hypothetical protein
MAQWRNNLKFIFLFFSLSLSFPISQSRRRIYACSDRSGYFRSLKNLLFCFKKGMVDRDSMNRWHKFMCTIVNAYLSCHLPWNHILEIAFYRTSLGVKTKLLANNLISFLWIFQFHFINSEEQMCVSLIMQKWRIEMHTW